jgi:uncharacterized DUF497 family protein
LIFDWDAGNIEHIALHGVSTVEAEYVLTHPTLDVGYEDWHGEERYAEVGATANGRILLVWTTWRGDRIRVVTAFDASKADALEYLRRVTR